MVLIYSVKKQKKICSSAVIQIQKEKKQQWKNDDRSIDVITRSACSTSTDTNSHHSLYGFIVKQMTAERDKRETHQSCGLDCTYSALYARGPPRRDSACTGGAHTQSHGRSESCPFPRIAPRRSSALAHRPTAVGGKTVRKRRVPGRKGNADLVVEAALLIEVIEESGIGGTAPEVQVCDLKVAPNFGLGIYERAILNSSETHSGRDCKIRRHCRRGNSSHCSARRVRGARL